MDNHFHSARARDIIFYMLPFKRRSLCFFFIFLSILSLVSCTVQIKSGFENMNLVIMGPPGCGKGTQSRRLSSKYNIPHITSGHLLREAAKEESELATFLTNELSKGKLIPDKIVNDILKRKAPCSGFILDGYPRRTSQVSTFSQVDLVILLEISDVESINRIISRREERSDDSQIIATKRLVDYKSEINDLKQYYSAKGILEIVDGRGTVDEVFSKIVNVIESRLSKLSKFIN